MQNIINTNNFNTLKINDVKRKSRKGFKLREHEDRERFTCLCTTRDIA